MKWGNQLTEAVLHPGDEKLKWYSSEELFQLGLTRGQIDRLMVTKAVRWARGSVLLNFLNTLGLVPDVQLGLNAIYYQVGDQYFVDRSPEGSAARSALAAMGVHQGQRCAVCQRFFPEGLLLPDQFQKLHCAECARDA